MPRLKLATAIRREQIVQAVFGLMAAAGGERLSLNAVARRLGLVPSALYRHFGSKDAIRDAVLDHVGRMLLGNVARVRLERTAALDRIERLLALHLGVIREHPGVPRVIFSEALTGGQPANRARVLGFIRAYLREIAAMVREGQAAGEVRRDLAPGSVAVLFLGLVQPAAMLHLLSDGRYDLTRKARRTWKWLRAELAAKRPNARGTNRGK